MEKYLQLENSWSNLHIMIRRLFCSIWILYYIVEWAVTALELSVLTSRAPWILNIKHMFNCLAWLLLCLRWTPKCFKMWMPSACLHCAPTKEKRSLEQELFFSAFLEGLNPAHKVQEISNSSDYFSLYIFYVCLCFHMPSRFPPDWIS